MAISERFTSVSAAQQAFNLSRLPDDAGANIRIVTIGDYDQCPCIGPHVASTGQIGTFQITSAGFRDGVLRIRFKLERPLPLSREIARSPSISGKTGDPRVSQRYDQLRPVMLGARTRAIIARGGTSVKVTVCQLDNRPGHLESMLRGLGAHIKDNASDFLLLPEMCFAEWLAADPQPDAARWHEAVAAHQFHIEKLP